MNDELLDKIILVKAKIEAVQKDMARNRKERNQSVSNIKSYEKKIKTEGDYIRVLDSHWDARFEEYSLLSQQLNALIDGKQ